MTNRLTSLFYAPLLLVSICASLAQDGDPGKKSDASIGVPRPEKVSFLPKHNSFLARGKSGPIGVLFLGDSITERWRNAPDIWEKFYGKWDPANFGIGGDQTQNVIWRLENGEMDGTHPKVVVLMLGTNNSALNSPGEIVAADTKIIKMILSKCPDTKVLLLAIFPRGPRGKAADRDEDARKRMEVINAVNKGLAKLDNGSNIFFLNINDKFVDEKGEISNDIMPDQLHPSPAGYEIWAEAMQPKLSDLMK